MSAVLKHDQDKPPPMGARLEISVTAAELGVSMAEMAQAASLGTSTLWRIVCANDWPKRQDHAAIKAALVELLASRGASDEQLRDLFNAHKRRRARSSAGVDPYNRPLSRGQNEPEDTDMLLPKQTLTPEARRAFQLLFNPFDGEVVSDEQMFTNSEIAYVREACMQAATGGRFVAVVSESGGGKTTILGDLESRIERDRKPVITIKPWVLGMEDNDNKGKTLKSGDILASIVTTLDPLAKPKQTLQARSNQARDLLSKSTEAGFHHLLVIEEAHSLPEATLKHLKRLHEMRLGRKALLGILLLGQTELALRLDPKRASLREVTQRCELVQLLPLDGDLGSYLAHRAKVAGRDLVDFIDTGGVEELRARLTVQRPGGAGKTRSVSLLYPLAVNNLMTAALNVAAELGAPVVSRDVVRGV